MLRIKLATKKYNKSDVWHYEIFLLIISILIIYELFAFDWVMIYMLFYIQIRTLIIFIHEIEVRLGEIKKNVLLRS